jgi:hypothetical protein
MIICFNSQEEVDQALEQSTFYQFMNYEHVCMIYIPILLYNCLQARLSNQQIKAVF